jgi:2-oxoglutarate dehydrogenase E2 component (dihydrolipoamide succinyltransferase)
MSEEIKIPSVGESITEITVGTFIKPNGSTVSEGDEIVELETEKVNQVLYAPKGGRLEWRAKEGDVLHIGDVIGLIHEGESGAKLEKKVEPKREASKVEEEPKEESHGTRKKMSRIRKVIADRLVSALRESAMLTTFNEVDMSSVMEKRAASQEAFTKKYGTKLGITSFFVFAAAQALSSFPEINSYLEGDEIVSHTSLDIGVAVGGAKGGLVVPVIRQCETKSLADIEKEIARLAAKAREGKLTMDEIEGGGFTITNGGVYGSLLSTPILNPPQVAILGMHKIEKRAVVLQDQIVIRPMMYLALSYDHRLIDGKEAVTFLVKIKELLEDPTTWVF